MKPRLDWRESGQPADLEDSAGRRQRSPIRSPMTNGERPPRNLRVMHQTKPEWERRDTNRLEIIRPCKVYVPRMEKYLAGTTWNISEGGALLQLNRPVVLERGQRVFVGIAAKRRDG